MSGKSSGLRLLIGMGSVAGFFGGWALLAHAPKPVGETRIAQANIAAPEAGFLAPQGLQPFGRLQPNLVFPPPQLRTRGS